MLDINIKLTLELIREEIEGYACWTVVYTVIIRGNGH